MSSKQCPICKNTYMNAEKHFRLNPKAKDGFSSYCKKCTSEINIFNKEKRKPPKDKKVCDNQECNNTFETRNKAKRFCCLSCANKENNKLRSKDREYRFKYEFNTKFKAKKMEQKNNFKRWTNEDDGLLLNLRFDGLTFWEIGEQMNRSYHSVGQRHRTLMAKLKLKDKLLQKVTQTKNI